MNYYSFCFVKKPVCGFVRIFGIVLLAVLFCAMAHSIALSPCYAQSALVAARDKGDYAAYKKLLDEFIADRLKKSEGFNPDDATLVHALGVAELIRATGEENMKKVAATSQGKAFLEKFLSDREWLAMYLGSGPYPINSAEGLEILAEILAADPDAATPQYMPLATAVALVFSAGEAVWWVKTALPGQDPGGKPVTPLSRYQYYKNSHVAKKLHPMFDNLRTYELRWVVCAPYSNESLEWIGDNINVPLSSIGGVCWSVRYRLFNDFSDSVHGAAYYAPGMAWMSWAENVSGNGGVCGSLSKFGATYAHARGIPAHTMGQPGHCAYMFRKAPNQWESAYGIGSHDGGAHYHFWNRSNVFVWMADDLFNDEEKTALAQKYYLYARYVLEKSGIKAAFPLYLEAIEKQPLHYGIYKDLVEQCIASSSGIGKENWKEIARRLLAEGSLRKYPAVACELLKKFEEKHMWSDLKPAQGRAYFLSVHKAVASNIHKSWMPWDMPNDLVTRQMNALKPDNKIEFYGEIVAYYVSMSADYMVGALLEWGNKNLGKNSEDQDKMIEAIVDGMAMMSGGKKAAKSVGDEAIESQKNLFRKLIVAAEASRNIPNFQKLSSAMKSHGKIQNPNPYPKLNKPGKLVSDKGVFYLANTGKVTDRYDNPLTHRGVLTEEGGGFHAPGNVDGQPNFAVVALPEAVKISTVVVANISGQNARRCTAISLSVSNDGASWQDVERVDSFNNGYVFDLKDKKITAKYIRIEKVADINSPFHLQNICVYE